MCYAAVQLTLTKSTMICFRWDWDPKITLCYAIVPPGQQFVFQAGFRPDSHRESFKIGPPAGRRADFDAFRIRIRPKANPEARFPAQTHYRCLRNKRPSEPYEFLFLGLGAMDVTKPYKCVWFGDIHGPKPYEFVGFRWPGIVQCRVARGPSNFGSIAEGLGWEPEKRDYAQP